MIRQSFARHLLAFVAGLSCMAFVAAQDCAKLKPNARDSSGETPLALALSKKDTPLVMGLLACKPDLAKKGGGGWYPLHTAAYFGPAEAVELMLKNGAKANERGDFDGWTPLHMAVQANKPNVAVIKALLAGGADKRLKSASGQTAYDMIKDNAALEELLPLLKP